MDARVKGLEQILISRATNRAWGSDPESAAVARVDYEVLRNDLLTNPTFAPLLPAWLTSCRDLDQFWSYIKSRFPSYEERRQHIWKAFAPAFAKLEGRSGGAADDDIAAGLSELSSASVQAVWQTALNRRATDPEAAITTARTLVETVCKHILTDLNTSFEDGADLPKLYGLTAQSLNLAPDQHTEQLFKQILGGCKTVVDGLGALRNRLSDSHGRGPAAVRPSARHAELAVNLAGAMSTFLVQTWKSRSPAI